VALIQGCIGRTIACAFAMSFAAATLGADESASKPIRFVVPLAAGSSIDARARVIAHALGVRLKQQVIVDNKPGAGGTIGAAYVAKAPPDGSTLLFINDSVVINAVNEGDLEATVHWHGLRLDNPYDGTAATQRPMPAGPWSSSPRCPGSSSPSRLQSATPWPPARRS